MRNIFITTLCALGIISGVFIAIVAFNGPECKHVFVEVEQPKIKIEQPEFTLGGGVYQEYSWPTGIQEGKELICVKCFHKQKQLIDYGKPEKQSTFLPPFNSTNCCDSIFTSGSSGAVFLKGGVLQVDTTGINKIITHAY
jgi:hypothetical protein